ncbi:hypothetical protein POTOM_052544 [Populus tomentosa]|uniref:Uncharacterized protein n=1 Tax=Populus tomentosa TaxID=118781 RepID=A0A8X8C0E3_POPTO|nr:hypothetical protein POTOM_052544 [Populus tomentosa]
MLQLFFAVAFSAVPLTLYVPPIRSLNLFVETMEDVLRQTSLYTVRAYPRIRLVFSRFFRNLFSLSREEFCLFTVRRVVGFCGLVFWDLINQIAI